MQNLEKRYAYSGRHVKREARRQMISTIVVLLMVLGLAAVCAVTYYHARGGFAR